MSNLRKHIPTIGLAAVGGVAGVGLSFLLRHYGAG
jgi:hypothetical protein